MAKPKPQPGVKYNALGRRISPAPKPAYKQAQMRAISATVTPRVPMKQTGTASRPGAKAHAPTPSRGMTTAQRLGKVPMPMYKPPAAPKPKPAPKNYRGR